MQVSIQLFGVPAVYIEGTRADVFRTQQARRLFCYLALRPNHAQSRELVAEALWGERSEGQANRTLRSELYRLRKGFDAKHPDIDGLLVAGASTIQLNIGGECRLDIDEFQRLGTSASAQPVELLSQEQVDALRTAATLYVAPLLVDFYEDWCLSERQRLHELHLEVLSKLLLVEARDGRYHEAVEYGYRILAEEPLMESVHRQVMRLHYRSGNRAAALRQYETCRRLLLEELGLEPMRRTRRIHEMILADRLELATDEPADTVLDAGAADPRGAQVAPDQPATGDEADAGANARMAAAQLRAATELLMDTARYLSKLGEQLARTD
jgi:DNA-binding SARP family transcriptional activator